MTLHWQIMQVSKNQKKLPVLRKSIVKKNISIHSTLNLYFTIAFQSKIHSICNSILVHDLAPYILLLLHIMIYNFSVKNS